MPQKRRIVDRLTGTGSVLCAGEKISDVRYDLIVWQKYLVEGNEELAGTKSVEGTLETIAGESYLIGKGDLVLRLEDRRLLTFLVHEYRMPSPAYSIVSTGGIRGPE